jgi:heptose I phosphotransferase
VIYLKRYGRPGAGALLKRWITRRSRAGAGWYDFAAALALAAQGVPVPRPIACGQDVQGLGEIRSFAMTEELPGADALERLLPRWDEKQADYALLRDRRRLVRELAALVRGLHRAGYYHRDLYLSHVFLSKDRTGQERLNLIDLQRVFKPLVCARRWQVKDLAQLYYSAQPYCTRTEVARFLRYYLDCRRLSDAQRRLVRAVYRKAQRIARREQRKRDPEGAAS